MKEKWINSVLKNYLKDYNPLESEVSHIKDWLSQTNEKISLRMSYPQALIKADKWTKRLNKQKLKGQGEAELIFTTTNNLSLLRLKDEASKAWEGREMQHCVASYTHHPGIYSLRREGKPVATLEVSDNHVKQIKGRQNRAVERIFHSAVFECLQFLNYPVLDAELETLGYFKIGDFSLSLLLDNFTTPPTHTLGNDIYLYVHDEVKLTSKADFDADDLALLKFFTAQGNLDLTSRFLRHTSNLQESSLRLVLVEALRWKRTEGVFLILNYINDPRTWGLTLQYFIAQKKNDYLERLLKASPFALGLLGAKPLDLAIQYRNLEAVKLLLLNNYSQVDLSIEKLCRDVNEPEITEFIKSYTDLLNSRIGASLRHPVQTIIKLERKKE